jgi:hypothetical protein
MSLITVISVLLASETYQGDIAAEQPEGRRLVTES